jgi:NAD(P)-dependent dehydrogenase (short-subunit alcohol dehydrogenase family)
VSSPPASFEGKVALVTGSSRSLGKAIALELVARGAAVAINSHSSRDEGEQVAEEIRVGGGRSVYVGADLADYDDARRAVEEVAETLGPIDTLVNNVDWFLPQMFEDNTPDYWDRIIGVGLRAAIHVTHAALPSLKKSGQGTVVNVVGDSGRVGLTGGAVHAAIKGGLIAITKSWAREFAPFGCRVNAVSPGGAFPGTKMWDDLAAGDLANILVGHELGSLLGDGRPSDVAYAVAFLASGEARHITGQTISVNGGRSFAS